MTLQGMENTSHRRPEDNNLSRRSEENTRKSEDNGRRSEDNGRRSEDNGRRSEEVARRSEIDEEFDPWSLFHYSWNPESEDPGFARLHVTAMDHSFRFSLQTHTCVVGRESGIEISSPDEAQTRQFLGYRTLELAKNDTYTVAIFRPAGLPPFGPKCPWTPFDITRLSFTALKKLSRTHFIITWQPSHRQWEVICLSNNGVNLDEGVKLREGSGSWLSPGSCVSAATQSVRITIYPATAQPPR